MTSHSMTPFILWNACSSSCQMHPACRDSDLMLHVHLSAILNDCTWRRAKSLCERQCSTCDLGTVIVRYRTRLSGCQCVEANDQRRWTYGLGRQDGWSAMAFGLLSHRAHSQELGVVMSTISNILHPTDFTPAAAFEMACSLAQARNARLTVIHVALKPITLDEVAASRRPDYRDDVR